MTCGHLMTDLDNPVSAHPATFTEDVDILLLLSSERQSFEYREHDLLQKPENKSVSY